MTMRRQMGAALIVAALALLCFLPLGADDTNPAAPHDDIGQVSDHFDGIRYFNPDVHETQPRPSRLAARWIWNWIFRTGWPTWPDEDASPPGPLPVTRVPEGALSITPVGHATFLIQMDGVNILTDPIWSQRCSPLSWVGPKRRHEPGIRFEDLPPIDAVLISHNHYDHLDLPTIRRLAQQGVSRSIVPLGNGSLVQGAGIPTVDELDWWQSVRLPSNIEVTLVPAQHFSSRTLRDRNRTLWGGFVVSGPSGNVFFAGDTGYGPHFGEIARRFSPIRAALLPIAPFRPQAQEGYRSIVHMGPAEAVQAHIDLGAPLSIAAHFQVFRLGFDGYNDAVDRLASSLEKQHLSSDAFVVPLFGQAIEAPPVVTASSPSASKTDSAEWGLFDSSSSPSWAYGENSSSSGRTGRPATLFTGAGRPANTAIPSLH